MIISTILLFILGTVLALFQIPVFVFLLILSVICYITANSYKISMNTDQIINSFNQKHSTSHAPQYIFSFLIPLIGFILGAILLSKEDRSERESGTNCILLGILSLVVSGVIVAICLCTRVEN